MSADPAGLAWRAREPNGWVDHRWEEVDRAVGARAHTLLTAGLQPGDRVAVAGPTSVAWLVTAFAIWRAGGVLVTVYPTVPDEEADHILHDSGAVFAFASSAAWRVRWVGRLDAGRVRDLSDADHPAQVVAVPRRGEDLAALVYTSGTTGRPKGVMLRHSGFVQVCRAVAAHTPSEPDDLQYLFLPLAHVYGLIVALAAVHVGAPSAIDGDTERIGDGLAATHPTFLPAVPRVFEKVLERAEGRARDRSAVAHRIFCWSVRVALAWSTAQQQGLVVPRSVRLQHALADRLVYRKVRAALGGRLRAVASGGAPLAPEVAALFHAAGIPVLEGYGLTETTAIATASRLNNWRIGAVGLPEEGVELRIAQDNEVLVRGPNVFAGYWNLPEATAEALTDGWLHTGDLGHIDASGFLHITGRKKDLIVTAGGKNIAPAKIENRLKAASPLIGEALVHGDRRPYCVALLALDEEAVQTWCRARGEADPAAAARSEALRSELQAAVDAVNTTLGSYESIKRFALLEHMPTVANGELTPSLKLKRRVLEQRHAAALDALYTAERTQPSR